MNEIEEYYHVIITLKSETEDDEIKLDLTKDSLIKKYIQPYENGHTITSNGKTINVFDIGRIKITKTKYSSEILIPEIRERRKASKKKTPGISNGWYVANEGKDVTDDFIISSPGYKKECLGVVDSECELKTQSSDKIFIVHGHDEEMKQSIARLIEKLDLKHIILHEEADEGKTIIENFETHSDNASFAIVLFSPDDKGCTVESFPDAAKFRARQNVILELGYFIGKLGRKRVLVLYNGSNDFELPSDIMGVLYTSYEKDWKLKLVKELQACGYEVDANKLLS